MPTKWDRRKDDEEVVPFQDPVFRRRSIHFDDLEFQRRFEQNLIRFGLVTGAQVTEEISNTVIVGGAGGGGAGWCYWTKEGSNLVYYEGNVGVGVHPHNNDFEVRGNALIEATSEQPYLEIRNWSDTARDPVISWALGATPTSKFTMGIDDSDSDKLKIANFLSLGITAKSKGEYDDQLIYFHIAKWGFASVDLVSWPDDALIVQMTVTKTDGNRYSIYQETSDGTYIYYNDFYKVQKIVMATGEFVAKLTYPYSSYCWGICHWAGKLYAMTITGFGSPSRIRLYVIDAASMTIDSEHEFVSGSGDDQFSNTRNMATDGENLYICDFGNNRIKKCTMAGVYVNKIATTAAISCEVAGAYLYVGSSATQDLLVYNKADLSLDGTVALEVVGGYSAAPTAVAVNGTHFYVYCSRTSPYKSIDKYDVATRTYQGTYDTVIDGQAASAVFSLHIGKFAASGERTPGDLLVIHYDGQYIDAWPKLRLMDDLRLVEDGDDEDGDYVGLAAPADVTTSYTLTFPAALPGAQAHVSCSSAGVLSFGQDVRSVASPTFVALILTQTTGTAPMTITSTTVVTNLNADLWDGLHSTALLGLNSLTDPGADRILFWDESENTLKWLTCGNSIAITATTLDTIQDIRTTASPTFVSVSVGVADTTRGIYHAYGPATGGDFGGSLFCYLGDDHNATISAYGFMVYEDDLLIGPDTNTDALKLASTDDLYITGGSLVLPASEYVNFGGTLGDGGYGIRDNAGTMEFKKSGGAWTEFGSGGGASAFLDLTDVDEADYTGHAGEFVVVNGDEGALVFSASSVAAHALTSVSHTDVNAGAPNDLDILQWDDDPGEWIAAPLPAAGPHDILSATHSDTAASAVSRGSLIYGNSTPKWAELVVGTVGQLLKSDGTDIAWAAQNTLKLDDFGACDDNTDLDATTSAHGLLKKLDDVATNFLDGDGAWSEPVRYWLPYPSGEYFGSFLGNPFTSSTAPWTADRVYATAFLVTKSRSFSKLSVHITSGQGAGRAAMIGLYADDGNGYPGALLEEGSVDFASSGQKDVTFASPRTLTPGLYWLAYNPNYACTIRVIPEDEVFTILGCSDLATKRSMYYSLNEAYDGSLPNPYAAGASKSSYTSIPFIALY